VKTLTFADLMLAGIFAVTLYALLNGWG